MDDRKEMRSVKTSIILSVILVLSGMAAMASADDSMPSKPPIFYGYVAINGEWAEPGTVVSVYIDGNPAGSCEVVETGLYSLEVMGNESDTITFKINDVPVDGTTAEWHEGDRQRLDLYIGDPPPGDDDDDSTVVTISDGDADTGNVTTVPITIENATDAVSGVTLRLWFDPEIVNVTEIAKGDFPGSFTTNPFFTADGWVRVVAEVGANTSLTDDRIVVANVTIAAAGVAGTSCSLRLEVESLLNDSFQTIAFTSVNGMFGIPVNGTAKGDVNNDGEVNVGDVTYLTRYLSGWTGYTVSPEVADVTGDNVVDVDDVLHLAKYVAGSPPTPVNGAVTGDMNGDGVVTSLDALMLLKAATGAITL